MVEAHASFIIVAIAGLVRPIQVRQQKLFTHCGIKVIELPCATDDLQALRRKVYVDAVVIDARSLPPTPEPAAAFVELVASSCATSGDLAPMSVVVLGNRHLPRWVRAISEEHGARFLSTSPRGPNYPELIRILREMRRVQADCCLPPTSPQRTSSWSASLKETDCGDIQRALSLHRKLSSLDSR
jgi:hypothetical protein